jgi:hypothetical protein
MKGKNLVSLVIGLGAEEYKFILRTINEDADNDLLVTILKAIRGTDHYNRKALAEKCGLKESRIRDLLPTLANKVVLALGMHEPDQPLELEIQLAAVWKLVFNIWNGPAGEVMQDLYDKATAVDRYDILYEILKLAEIMTVPAEIKGLSRAELTEKHLNLLQYQELKLKADKLTTLAGEERKRVADELSGAELMSSIEAAQSVSAKAHYYWIKRRISFSRENYASTLVFEKKLIDLLEENRWLDRYDDFFFALEHRSLITLLLIEDSVKEAHNQLFRVGGFNTEFPLSTTAKWEQLFPTKIGVALNNGEIETGLDAVDEFLKLISENEGQFSEQFITRNLYYSAYFLFTIGEFEKVQRMFTRMNKFQNSSSFPDPIFPISKILETFLAYESGELVEMGRLGKNFSMTSAYKKSTSGYYKYALSSLGAVSRQKDSQDVIEEAQKAIAKIAEMHDDSYFSILNSYFDVSAWLESKKEGYTMSEVFRNRASNKSKAKKAN